ncbi:MAG: hypothetical protein ACJA00_005647 [Myxococcota bacterium]|jgi:hypothetical protein
MIEQQPCQCAFGVVDPVGKLMDDQVGTEPCGELSAIGLTEGFGAPTSRPPKQLLRPDGVAGC